MRYVFKVLMNRIEEWSKGNSQNIGPLFHFFKLKIIIALRTYKLYLIS